MKTKKKKGFFITLEGGEGSGKSTQSKILASRLEKEGYSVFLGREPGTTPLTEKIREGLLKLDEKRSAETDLLLFEAARNHFVNKIVKPNLEKGKIMISDRYFDSTTAYQGYGCGVSSEIIDYLNNFASCNVSPDLTFIIDISEKKGLEKTIDQSDNFSLRKSSFHKRVNQGYREIAKNNPDRCVLIPYQENKIEETAKKIYETTIKRLKK